MEPTQAMKPLELHDERTLTLCGGDPKNEGDVFPTRGIAPYTSEDRLYWEVLEVKEHGAYRCKLVGVNAYLRAIM